MTDSNTTQARKRAAVEFLTLATSGKIDQAYEKYVDMQGKHHNPYFAAGFAALKKGMIENHAQFPNKRLTVHHVLGDGDLVAVHFDVVLSPGGKPIAGMHVFRFEGDKIVEMWDVGQPVPADSPNTDGVF